MQFDVWTKGLPALETECLVLGVFDDGELSDEAQSIDGAVSGALSKLVSRGDFPGRSGETLLIGDLPGIKAQRVMLVGLGAKKNYTRKVFRKAVAATTAAINRTRIASAAFALARPSFKDLDD